MKVRHFFELEIDRMNRLVLTISMSVAVLSFTAVVGNAQTRADKCFRLGTFKQSNLNCLRALLEEQQKTNALLLSIKNHLETFGPKISNISNQANSIDGNVANINSKIK